MGILDDVKSIVGVPIGTTAFDMELLFNIRSVAVVLSQLGVAEYSGLTIDENSDWPILLSADLSQLVQQYLVTKVKTQFDPKANQAVAQAINEHLVELEGRIMFLIDELEAEEV